jgi:hypothetical protein
MNCGTSFAYIYFIGFQLIFSIVFLNLFIAVILEGFSESSKTEHSLIKQSSLDHFKYLWAKFDPLGAGFIQAKYFEHFLDELEYPLGFRDHVHKFSLSDKQLIIADLMIPVIFLKEYKTPLYSFHEVLLSLCRRAMVDELGILE